MRRIRCYEQNDPSSLKTCVDFIQLNLYLLIINQVLSKAHSSLGCVMKIKYDEFSIFSSGRSIFDLRVKEVYLIQCMKPELNTKYEKIKRDIDIERQQKH